MRKNLKRVKNILVIRTDRIGEVLLTTPILTALKETQPEAKISMMVRPEVKGIVEDNPNLSEIIEYRVASAIKLAKTFRNKKFDLAIIVNPKKEFHLAAFLAGIPIRVGFNRKWGFLLTHRIKDLKFLSEKHEVESNLDLVRAIGIEPKDKKPVLVIRDAFPVLDIPEHPVAIHPCTSNPKKQWPEKSFARLADLLAESGYNAVLVSGPDEVESAKRVMSMMKNKPVDLAGKLTLKQLAVLLKRCEFLVSCDSGPVHIAAAMGTSAVVLFGKADRGSRPKRWGPYGERHIVIQKDKIEDILPEEVAAKIHSRGSFQGGRRKLSP